MAVDLLNGFVLASGQNLASITQLVTKVSCNWAPGTVAELRIELADPNGKLQSHGLLALGTALTALGTSWQVGSVDRTYTGWGVQTSVAARSKLAKTLRLKTGTSHSLSLSPAQWITRKVAAAGGTAICQPGANKRSIVQKRGQSVLDVIVALAETTGVEWVEADGTMIVGTPWWAYVAGPALPTWPVTWRRRPETDAMALTATVSEDDKTSGASASLTLPYSQAAGIRPWHRISLSGAGAPLDGIWLVADVTLELGTAAPVSLNLVRPLRTFPKKGSAKASPVPVEKKPDSSPDPEPSKKKKDDDDPAATGGTHRPYAHSDGITSTNGRTALDYAMPRGTALYAVRDGYVISCRDGVRNHARGGPASKWPAASNYVLLGVKYKGKDARVLYWHMSPGLRVEKGQRVSAGQRIGSSGNTGHSTGDHLHIQAAWGHQDNKFGGSIIWPPSQIWRD